MHISSILGFHGYILSGGTVTEVTPREKGDDQFKETDRKSENISIGQAYSFITTTTTMGPKFYTMSSNKNGKMFPRVENTKITNVTTTYDATLMKQNSMLIEIIFVLSGFLLFMTLSKMQI